MKKSKKSLTIIMAVTALAVITVVFLAACNNPLFPFDKKNTVDTPVVSLVADPIGPYVEGEEVTITVEATVNDFGTLSYQWYSNTVNSNSGGTLLENETGTEYSLTTSSDLDNFEPSTTYYYVEVTNTLNGKTASASSDVADISVYNIPVWMTPIREVAVTLPPPVKDGIPATRETVELEGSGYTVTSVMWSPPHPVFYSGTVYTVMITLQAENDYTFAALRTATVNGDKAGIDIQGTSKDLLFLTYRFESVDVRLVTGITVKTQPSNLSYTHGDTLRLQGLEVTLTYDSGEPEDVPFASFASRIITTNPAHGITLSHTDHDNTAITVSCNNITDDTSPLTVSKKTIEEAWVGISPPAKGEAVVYTASVLPGAGYTASNVTWTPDNNFIDGNKFQGNTEYTATVTITAEADYDFAASLTANINNSAATVAGSGNTSTLSFEFPKTLTGTVSGITVTNPTKLSYTHGDLLDLAGLVVTVNFEEPGEPNVILNFPADAGAFQTLPAHGEPVIVSNSGSKINVNYSGHNAQSPNSLTVGKKALTLNTTNARHTKVYDKNTTASSITGITLNGIVGQDNVYINGAVNGVYTSANTGTTTVNITEVNLLGTHITNYTFALPVNNVQLTGTTRGITQFTTTVTWGSLYGFNGLTLSSVKFFNSSTRGVGSDGVPGSFAWVTSTSTVLTTGSRTYSARFTPSDSTNYSTVTNSSLGVTVIADRPQDEMVSVAGGSFYMGRQGDGGGTGNAADVTPVRQVTLSAYYISKYEITQEQYAAVVGKNPSGSRVAREGVSWFQALVFCNRLSIMLGLTPVYSISGSTNPDDWGDVPSSSSSAILSRWNAAVRSATANGYQLPTEAQWEYAAKGRKSTGAYIYAGSNVLNDVARNFSADRAGPHEVGKRLPNELGLYDMSGNVSEWCWDWYAAYGSAAQTDPTGPSSGNYRVYRGGCTGFGYQYDVGVFRSVYRLYTYPYNNDPAVSSRGTYTGFRLVRRN